VTADPAAWLLRAQVTADFRPTPKWALSLTPRAQLSGSPLIGYEQFSAGNYTIGRGFDPGAVQGDDGAGFNFELRRGTGLPESAKDLALQPYAFFDSAWVWARGPVIGPRHDNLQSAGAGLRAQWGNRGRADLTLAVPLDRTAGQTKMSPVRLLFSISTQLLPW
jgi:hemolysin activation/secretion protein